MRAIRRSEYLSFAYQQLTENNSNTVVSVSGSAQDAHIVDALRAGSTRDVAVAVLPGTRVEVAGCA
jgi:hypothetical protein